jgi:hypothetical protein
LALTIIYYILYKKGVLGFLDPKNMKKWKRSKEKNIEKTGI